MHNEELHDLYSSPNTTWVIRSTRMRMERQEVYKGKRTGAYKFWWVNLTESDHLEDFGVDIRITYIQGVTGRTDQTSGECSLGHTILI